MNWLAVFLHAFEALAPLAVGETTASASKTTLMRPVRAETCVPRVRVGTRPLAAIGLARHASRDERRELGTDDEIEIDRVAVGDADHRPERPVTSPR